LDKIELRYNSALLRTIRLKFVGLGITVSNKGGVKSNIQRNMSFSGENNFLDTFNPSLTAKVY